MINEILNRKTTRNINKSKEIKLIIGEKKEYFDLICYKLEKANELFSEYKSNYKNLNSVKKKWEKINEIINLIEINPIFNYEFLKINQIYDKTNYEYNFNQLSPTLSENDYFLLTNKHQENPAKILFELLNLCLNNESKFDEKTKQIKNINYNIPLIEGNEKIRVNYYIHLLSHFEIYLNENQKQYLLNQNNKINKDDKKNFVFLKNKYEIIKKGIKFFVDLIPKMKNFFCDIKLEDNNFNLKIFTFMLYITDVIQRIPPLGIEPMNIINFFQKEIDPIKELLENNSLDNIIKPDKNFKFPNNYGIRKKYNNDLINNNDKNKEKKIYEYEIFNEFESIIFDGRDYILTNLIFDYKINGYIPLDILLLRNQSLSFFEKNNKNFLNVNDNIFNEFKAYFKFFIRSKCVEEAFLLNEKYKNIINLINDDDIINNFLSDKYLKSIPLFEFSGSGYTNKDILLSCVTGFPIMIYRYNTSESLKEYKNLKGIIILFNIGMKMVTTLHELIIHLSFGYLNYISEGKISYESPKKGNKNLNEDGGLYFEQLLFGNQYGNIHLNDILVILNGEYFNSLTTFQENLSKELDLDNFKVKSKLLSLILTEYDITLNTLKNNNKTYSKMKTSESGMCIKRDIDNIILSYKAPIPKNY